MSATYAVVLPRQMSPERRGTAVYLRRRCAVLAVLFALVAVLWLGVGSVLANRGGAPGSVPAVRPGQAASTWVVQPGDTLWSIGQAAHGSDDLADYVDDLVVANGGTHLEVGRAIPLP